MLRTECEFSGSYAPCYDSLDRYPHWTPVVIDANRHGLVSLGNLRLGFVICVPAKNSQNDLVWQLLLPTYGVRPISNLTSRDICDKAK